MQDIAFATLLFCIYFCFSCCFLYKPHQSTQKESISSGYGRNSQVEVETELKVDLWEIEPIAIASKDNTPDTQVAEPTLEKPIEGIDLDNLQLRPARKICGRLGIQQKVNGKDAPLSWLRAQIKARLIEKPIEVAPLIQEVLKAS